jgi:hypothetical protein
MLRTEATAMPRHRKDCLQRKPYGKLSEQDILDMLTDGRLFVDVETGQVSVASGRFLIPFPCKGRYLFVRVHANGCRRGIAVHKLVWMKVHGCVVPEGCDVHHKDRRRQNNHYKNLEVEEMGPHRSSAALTGAAERYGYPIGWDIEEEFDLADF